MPTKPDWIKKIEEGMNLIREGCQLNGEWGMCTRCPFTDYCDILMDAAHAEGKEFDEYSPYYWGVEKDADK